jgi:ABC-type transport system substrate-binding protein
VFRFNELGDVTSLDPAMSGSFENNWAINQLYNGLVEMDDSLNVEPCIATSWTISDDGLIYTFHLRQDVVFHDDPQFPGGKGRKVTASDFVFSFDRLFDRTVSNASTLMDGSAERLHVCDSSFPPIQAISRNSDDEIFLRCSQGSGAVLRRSIQDASDRYRTFSAESLGRKNASGHGA